MVDRTSDVRLILHQGNSNNNNNNGAVSLPIPSASDSASNGGSSAPTSFLTRLRLMFTRRRGSTRTAPVSHRGYTAAEQSLQTLHLELQTLRGAVDDIRGMSTQVDAQLSQLLLSSDVSVFALCGDTANDIMYQLNVRVDDAVRSIQHMSRLGVSTIAAMAPPHSGSISSLSSGNLLASGGSQLTQSTLWRSQTQVIMSAKRTVGNVVWVYVYQQLMHLRRLEDTLLRRLKTRYSHRDGTVISDDQAADIAVDIMNSVEVSQPSSQQQPLDPILLLCREILRINDSVVYVCAAGAAIDATGIASPHAGSLTGMGRDNDGGASPVSHDGSPTVRPQHGAPIAAFDLDSVQNSSGEQMALTTPTALSNSQQQMQPQQASESGTVQQYTTAPPSTKTSANSLIGLVATSSSRRYSVVRFPDDSDDDVLHTFMSIPELPMPFDGFMDSGLAPLDVAGDVASQSSPKRSPIAPVASSSRRWPVWVFVAIGVILCGAIAAVVVVFVV
eukprot:PhM_4_TR17205/c0_g1_i1/m.3521